MEGRPAGCASVEGIQQFRCAWQGAGKLSMTAFARRLQAGWRSSSSSKPSIIAALAIEHSRLRSTAALAWEWAAKTLARKPEPS